MDFYMMRRANEKSVTENNGQMIDEFEETNI